MSDLPAAVYTIRCARTARIYVGSSNHPKQRWAAHRSDLKQGKHHNQKLQRSYTKYGKEALTFEIIETVERVTDLRAREQFWIEVLNATCEQLGFNLLPTAGSPLGHKASPETRAKMRAAHLGKSPSAEHRAALSAARKGCVGRPLSPETIERLRQHHLGRKRIFSPETLAKMSAAKKGKPNGIVFTDEVRQRIRAKAHGRTHSDATREKIRLALSGKKLSPERVAAMSQIRKGVPLTAAHKAAIGAAQKRRFANAKPGLV